MDCIGIVTQINIELGWGDYDRTDYGTTPFRHELEAGLRRLFGPPVGGASGAVDYLEPQPGDIILFEWARAGRQHVGIRTELGMIHAYQTGRVRVAKQGARWGRGRVVETAIGDKLRQRIKGVYRWRV